MTERGIRLAAAVLVGLTIALACPSAVAALMVLDDASSLASQDENLLQAFASQILASTQSAGTCPHSDPDSAPLQEKQDSQPSYQAHVGLLSGLGTGCNSSCSSQVTGNGWSGAALPGTTSYVPRPTAGMALPGEAITILPTGAPFELLRPPRTIA